MIWFQCTIYLHSVWLLTSHEKNKRSQNDRSVGWGSSLEVSSPPPPVWSRTATNTRPIQPWLSPANSWKSPRMHFLLPLQVPISGLYCSLGETTSSSVQSLPPKLHLVPTILSSTVCHYKEEFGSAIMGTPFKNLWVLLCQAKQAKLSQVLFVGLILWLLIPVCPPSVSCPGSSWAFQWVVYLAYDGNSSLAPMQLCVCHNPSCFSAGQALRW